MSEAEPAEEPQMPEPSKALHGAFTIVVKLVFLTLGVAAGIGVYAAWTARVINGARAAIADAPSLPTLLAADPTLVTTMCTGTSSATLDEHQALRLLQGLSLIPRDYTDLKPLSPLHKPLGIYSAGPSLSVCRPGLQLLVGVALDSGVSSNTRHERLTTETDVSRALAAWLAQVPRGEARFKECMTGMPSWSCRQTRAGARRDTTRSAAARNRARGRGRRGGFELAHDERGEAAVGLVRDEGLGAQVGEVAIDERVQQ